MAIYHLTVKTISRSKGQSAVAAAAYRRAEHMQDARYEKTHDYTAKNGVVHSEITIPDNAPTWMVERLKLHETDPRLASEQFWNFVEIVENRKDAQLAREIEFALPVELNKEQNIALARDFIREQFALRGMVADWSVHWDKGNPHVHVMLTLRELSDLGFGKKVRDWNATTLLQEWRTKWAEYANFHLRLNQHDVCIDHRSYKDQGIALIPTIHQGRAVTDMHRRGIDTAIMQEANSIRQANLSLIAKDPGALLKKITTQSTTFSHEQLGQELGRYINDQGHFSTENIGLLSEAALENIDQEGMEAEESSAILTPESIAKILQTIEQHESVFSERDLVKAVSGHTDNAEAFARAVIALKNSPDLIALGAGDDGRDRFTTRQMFDLENKLQKVADELRERVSAAIPKKRVNSILSAYEQKTGKSLTQEQHAAVIHILKPQAVTCLVGRAGTGKSFSLGAAREAWEAQGLTVHGVALSGIAADGLSKDAGIASRTIESFRYAVEKETLKLNDRSVVVMDEAGMSDTHSMLAVLNAVQQAHAKLVLVGDHAQLQPVGPGASFRALLERIGFAEIQTIYRQTENWQRQATANLATGRVGDAIDAYDEAGCVHLEKTAEVAMRRLVTDWMEHRAASSAALQDYMVIAYENKDVDQLNHLLRQARVAGSEIAAGYIVNTASGEKSIAAGDRLVFLKNDRSLGVSNGRFATVESVHFTESGRVIDFRVKLDGTEKIVQIDPTRYKDFAYGYAATVYKVQGVTVDHVLPYIGRAGWNKNASYVALTRHRKSCHLYASQENHADLAKLKKGLSRYAVKDSVLDFPLAFAQRRGIDNNALLKLLPQHLSRRLSALKTQFSDRYQQLVNPKAYWQQKEAAAQEKTRTENLTQTREDARLVAAYVDKSRAVGMAYETLQGRLKNLGFESVSYAAEDFSIISDTPEYIALQRVLHARDAAAIPLFQTPERFSKAFEIYGLDIAKLQQESLAHEKREQVALYQTLKSSGKTVARDKLAAHMMSDIKAYYRHLKAAGIDTQQLRIEGTQHLRRALLAHSSLEERQAFYAVEKYQMLTQQLGKAFSVFKNVSDKTSPNSLYIGKKLNDLSQAREAVAARIAANPALYQTGLSFFQIGESSPLFGGHENEEKQNTYQLQAQGRLEKLEQAATRYHIRERVKQYLAAQQGGDIALCRHLAHQIIEDPKAHHGAVVNHSAVPSELWKAIRTDAKSYERDILYESLSTEEKVNFSLVESYVTEKRASASAWSAVFEAKNAGLPEIEWKEQLTAFAKEPSYARDKLASAILSNIEAFEKGLQFYKIEVAQLKKAAYAHECRERVTSYKDEKSVWLRSKLANIIFVDPKSHHGAILEAHLSWKQLHQDKRHFERSILFGTLSKEEKQLWRLAEKYRKANRAVGRTYGKIFAAKNSQKPLDIKCQQTANILLSKRDYFAGRLQEQKESLQFSAQLFGASDSLAQFEKYHAIDWQKISGQAKNHHGRIAHIQTWQSAQQPVIRMLPHLLHDKATDQSITLNQNAYYDWLAIGENAAQVAKPIAARIDTYTHAFQATGISKQIWQKQALQEKEIKQSLYEIEARLFSPAEAKSPVDVDLIKRIERARHIERNTQLIRGTLAERYLREHRGIQGPIPASYRYHPAVYHGEAKQCLPALVVVAKNRQKETQAVQVIFLDKTTANKAKLNSPKLTYGSLSQGNVGVLVNAGKDSQTLAVAEGPETALSISEANPDLRVYAVLGSGNFGRPPICPDTKKILFCADNDGKNSASQKKLHAAAEKLSVQGIEVWQATPDKEKQDFNDVLKAQGKEAVRIGLESAYLIQTAKTAESLRKLLLEVATKGHSKTVPEKHPVSGTTTEVPLSVETEKDKSREQRGFEKISSSEEIDISISSYERLALEAEEHFATLEKAVERSNASYNAKSYLEKCAARLSEQTKIMSYLKQHNPQLASKVEELAKRYERNRELDRDISR